MNIVDYLERLNELEKERLYTLFVETYSVSYLTLEETRDLNQRKKIYQKYLQGTIMEKEKLELVHEYLDLQKRYQEKAREIMSRSLEEQEEFIKKVFDNQPNMGGRKS